MNIFALEIKNFQGDFSEPFQTLTPGVGPIHQTR